MSKELHVHNLEHARIAFKAAQELKIPVTLSTPPNALAYSSIDYFKEIFRIARCEYPDAQATCIIDCSGYPGMAMYALRQRISHVRYLDDNKYTQQLQSMAQQNGTVFLTESPDNIFNFLDQKNPREACHSWLYPALLPKVVLCCSVSSQGK